MNPTTSGSTLPTWTKSRGPLMLACPVVLMPSVLTEVNKEQLYAHTVPWAINSPSVYPVPARIPVGNERARQPGGVIKERDITTIQRRQGCLTGPRIHRNDQLLEDRGHRQLIAARTYGCRTRKNEVRGIRTRIENTHYTLVIGREGVTHGDTGTGRINLRSAVEYRNRPV